MDPIYSIFFTNHPSLIQRVENLEKFIESGHLDNKSVSHLRKTGAIAPINDE